MAIIGIQLFSVRLAVLLAFWPLLILAYAAAMTDGLVQRAIRRAGGRHESASLYHRAKHLQLLLLVTTGAVSLLLPESIDLRSILVPSVMLIAILGRIQWAYFKKHL